MIETPYNTNVAQAAANLKFAYDKTVTNHEGRIERAVISQKLGELADTGVFGKIATRGERKTLTAQFEVSRQRTGEPDGLHAVSLDSRADMQDFNRRQVDASSTDVRRALKNATDHFKANYVAYYDNAVVEANVALTDRRDPNIVPVPQPTELRVA